jgi:hypothetical protein
MKFSQKLINAILFALLAALGFSEYQGYQQPEIAFAKQAPAPGEVLPEPQLIIAPYTTDENLAQQDEKIPTWYCWLSYWIPNREDCDENIAFPKCETYSWYAHPNRIKLVQKNKPTKKDFIFDNGLYIPFQLRKMPGLDTSQIELAGIYSVKVATPFQ